MQGEPVAKRRYSGLPTITLNNHYSYAFWGGGAWSYISAPVGSPEYIDYISDLEAPVVRISYADTQEFSYVLLEWDAVSGASAYNVYSSFNPDSGYSLEPDGAGITTLNWFDYAEFGARKFYIVTAVD